MTNGPVGKSSVASAAASITKSQVVYHPGKLLSNLLIRASTNVSQQIELTDCLMCRKRNSSQIHRIPEYSDMLDHSRKKSAEKRLVPVYRCTRSYFHARFTFTLHFFIYASVQMLTIVVAGTLMLDL